MHALYDDGIILLTGGLACQRHAAEGGIEMKQNEVYNCSKAQDHIAMKKNAVYGVTVEPRDHFYENPLQL